MIYGAQSLRTNSGRISFVNVAPTKIESGREKRSVGRVSVVRSPRRVIVRRFPLDCAKNCVFFISRRPTERRCFANCSYHTARGARGAFTGSLPPRVRGTHTEVYYTVLQVVFRPRTRRSEQCTNDTVRRSVPRAFAQ